MKHLLLCLSVIFGYSFAMHAAENLIVDSGFETTVAFESGTGDPTAGTLDGVWYNKVLATGSATTWALASEAGKGTVAKCERTGTASWFNSFLAQKSATVATKGMYRLVFDAKASAAVNLNAYIKSNVKYDGTTETFILPKGTVAAGGAGINTAVTTSWKTYCIDFDFSKLKLGYNSGGAIVDATDDQLQNFYITLWPAAVATYYIDNVKLIRLDPDAFIQEDDFENTALQSGTTDPMTDLLTGKWYTKLTNTYAAYSLTADQDKGQVVSMVRDGQAAFVWYQTYLGQKVYQAAEKDIYKLTFDAKSPTAGAEFSVYLRIFGYTDPTSNKTENFFILKDGEAEASYKRQALTDTWTSYSVEFDLKKYKNSVYASGNVVNTLDEMLQNFYVAFAPITPNATYYIDNVTFKKSSNTGLFPKRAINELNIHTEGYKITVLNATETIRVYDSSGRLLVSQPALDNTINVNNKGIYIVKCGEKTGKVFIR